MDLRRASEKADCLLERTGFEPPSPVDSWPNASSFNFKPLGHELVAGFA